MFKMTFTIMTVLFFGGSWFTGDIFPRFTHTSADYFFMPLLGYLFLIASAQCAMRFFPGAKDSAR